MNIQDIAISRLKEYENNPRNNEVAVEKVKISIKRFGFLFPIIIDANYVIVCGHTRYNACRELGIQTVPCIIADELNEEQINLFRLVDNKVSEYSEWDFDKLKKELSLIDLSIDENKLLLEQFDLTADVLDLEAKVSEIDIPSINFKDVSDRAKKDTVSTINGVVNANSEDEDEDDDSFESELDDEELMREFADEDDEKVPDDKDDPKPRLSLCRFRFGETAFYISKIELDRLNKAFADYADSDAVEKISFVEYLLEGVESRA